MPRVYKRKTETSWDKHQLLNAIEDYHSDSHPSGNKSAKRFGTPEPKLGRYLKKNPVNYPIHGGRFRNTFSDEQLEQLKNYITDIDKRSFGLTKYQCQRLVYDFSHQNNIPHRFNNETKLAGDDWMLNFMSIKKFELFFT